MVVFELALLSIMLFSPFAMVGLFIVSWVYLSKIYNLVRVINLREADKEISQNAILEELRVINDRLGKK